LAARHNPVERDRARNYVVHIQECLDDPKRHWAPGQRKWLRELLMRWTHRAHGMDAHFERFGTFHRHPTGDAPTESDRVIERMRRRAMEQEGYKSSAQTRRESRVSLRVRCRDKILAQWRKQAGIKGDGIIDKTKADLWDD
jgi:hypothetical protein